MRTNNKFECILFQLTAIYNWNTRKILVRLKIQLTSKAMPTIRLD